MEQSAWHVFGQHRLYEMTRFALDIGLRHAGLSLSDVHHVQTIGQSPRLLPWTQTTGLEGFFFS